MNIFFFATNDHQNVRIAYDERIWMIGMGSGDQSFTEQLRDRVRQHVRIGDLVFFWTTQATPMEHERQRLSMPSVITSIPDPIAEPENCPFPGTWRFPFEIRPLGRPSISVGREDLEAVLDVTEPSKFFGLSGTFAFRPKQISVPQLKQLLLSLMRDDVPFGEYRRAVREYQQTRRNRRAA